MCASTLPWILSWWKLTAIRQLVMTVGFVANEHHRSGFPHGSVGKETAHSAGDLGLTLDWEDSLEEGMATHSSLLAWRIPGGAWRATVHGVAESETTERLGTAQHHCSGNLHITEGDPRVGTTSSLNRLSGQSSKEHQEQQTACQFKGCEHNLWLTFGRVYAMQTQKQIGRQVWFGLVWFF